MNIKEAYKLKKEDGETTTMGRSYKIAEAVGYIECYEKAEKMAEVLQICWERFGDLRNKSFRKLIEQSVQEWRREA